MSFGFSATNGDLGYNGFPVSLSYFAAAPDPALIADANLSVIFKSLLKKNSVTKEKNLSDLVSLLETTSHFDETLLMCWVQLYPKLALDNSRSVRALSHQVQATLLKKVGGKDFTKYLKSSVPIWLQSLYDNDRSVASATYSAMLDCFQNDKERVDSKIWFVFYEQIVNYIHAVVSVESHDSLSDQRYVKESDSFAKYNRALNGALMMTAKLVDLVNGAGEFPGSEASVAALQEVLTLEKTWDGLSCSGGDSFDAPLFKTYLTLIRKLFTLSKDGDPLVFSLKIGDLKGIYKVISKRFIKNVKLKVDLTKASGIIYSSIILHFWDTLSALTSFTQLNLQSRKSFKIKKNFWELGGSKSYSRFKEYLKLGPCNSDPLYYNILKSFFKTLSGIDFEMDDKFRFLDFHLSKDASFVTETLLLQLPKLQGAAFKKAFVDCIFDVIGLFDSPDKSQLRSRAFLQVLDAIPTRSSRQDSETTKKQLNDSLSSAATFVDTKSISEQIAKHVSSRELLQIDDHKFSSSYLDIVEVYTSTISQEQCELFLDSFLLNIQDVYDEDLLEKAFKSLLVCLKKVCSEELKQWIPLLPGYFSSKFYQLPLEVLQTVLNGDCTWLDVPSLLDDVFTKLSADVSKALPRFFIILQETGYEGSLKAEVTSGYLESLSQSHHRTHEENLVISKHISNGSILKNLLQTKAVRDDPSKLILILVLNEFIVQSIDEEVKESWIHILKFAFAHTEYLRLAAFLDGIKDIPFLKAIISSYIQTGDAKLEDVCKYVAQHTDLFPLEELSVSIGKAIDHVDLNTLVIANPIAQNLHLASQTNNETKLVESSARVAHFLESYSNVDEVDNWTYGMLELGIVVSEYIKDYMFLSSWKTDLGNLGDIQSSLSRKLQEEIDSSKVTKELFSNPDSQSGFQSRLFNSIGYTTEPTIRQLYATRALVESWTRRFEGYSLTAFDNLDIPFTKLVKEPLKLASILIASTKFMNQSSKLERIKGFVFAEILGVTSSADILSKGKQWLAIGINFLYMDEDAQTIEFLPTHKMGLLINNLASWLESDVAYDQEFFAIRSLLAMFFEKLITLQSTAASDKTIETAFDLCLNNLSTCEINAKELELRYFTIRLCNTLAKHFADSDQWKENLNALTAEVLDVTGNDDIEQEDCKVLNQAVLMINELFRRFLFKAETSKSLIADNTEKLYGILLRSKFIDIQRVAASFLELHILESQVDMVVEYQLKKSSLGDDEGSSTIAELPKPLLEVIEQTNEYWDEVLEDGNLEVASKYLWSWALIFSHFKDVTYSIKNDYINQLKKSGAIDKLFTDLQYHVDFADASFLKTLVSEGGENNQQKVNPENNLISTYEISKGCIGETVQYEMRFLFVHLYYLCLQHFGSLAQHWCNEIRDLQLKSQVEKFTLKFISPLLISKMLGDVERVKSRLTDKDENLSIRVNNVTNEIRTIYNIDEQRMEMVVKIPDTFPLSSVEVQGPLRLGVKENQWKAWLLASQRVVSLTNGSIIDCIELFNRNVNLHFSGFEECAICYSILHQDHSLPSKTCPTCSNKFHAACLYKWFKSSGSSTCPLCRTAFNFRTAKT